MTTAQAVVIGVFGVLLGSAVGSFMCVIIDRLPVYLEEPNDYGEHWDTRPWPDVLGGHSRCSSCGEPVRRIDNIPVLSWILLRGRCRNPDCAERIPAYHPLVELAVPAVGAAVVWTNGWTWALLPYLWLVPIGVAVSVIDWRTLIVPTRLIWPAFGVSVALTVVAALLEGEPRWLFGGLLGIAVLSGPLFGLWWITASKGMGFGDVRLTVLLGWTVGFAAMAAGGPLTSAVMMALVVMVVAAVLGLVIGVLALVTSPGQVDESVPFRRRQVPFGPSLVAASFLALVFAEPFVQPFIG